jgi:predicted nucleotide-binding protein
VAVAAKKKTYRDVKFSPAVIQAAYAVYDRLIPNARRHWTRNVGISRDERWDLDTDEEFFAKYRGEIWSAGYSVDGFHLDHTNFFGMFESDVHVTSEKISDIEAVFAVFEDHVDECRIERPVVRPRIFMGHGRDDQWRDLRDDLRDHHGLDVYAYETGVHAGESITEVLDEMTSEAGLALLVHTGEDEVSTEDGDQRRTALQARQNVIHETGLFQGVLGWKRALVLRERDCDGFSNIHGIQELRFERGHIREMTGEVLAVIEREFGAR